MFPRPWATRAEVRRPNEPHRHPTRPEPRRGTAQRIPAAPQNRRQRARSRTPATHTQAPGQGPPTIRTRLNHVLKEWLSGPVSPAGVLLVARRHVDLLRVASALCRPVR
ncbi:putative leader peptide [Amycolatopsis sp. NPDC051373]|uniref:putative leader peptide n=1 Tax=Amycolatopsis sp. NPDC051373 TaxID=3155801 RepID=UPI00344F19EE